ncbi:hypothetical protein BDV12DRAFT_162349 [Aspergillus spectabilis]
MGNNAGARRVARRGAPPNVSNPLIPTWSVATDQRSVIVGLLGLYQLSTVARAACVARCIILSVDSYIFVQALGVNS